VISVLTNTIELIERMERDVEAFEVEAPEQIHEATGDILETLRKDVSGRKTNDMGLNIRTGNLLMSLAAYSKRLAQTIMAAVYNTNASYWYYHEVGAGHNPKRLNWFDYWNTAGHERLTTGAGEAMARLA
jgi:hypothetical protein